MTQLPRLFGHLPQFWKIPGMVGVSKITVRCDLKCGRTAEPASAAPAPPGNLQVETDSLATDQNRSRIDQLLRQRATR